MGGGCEGGGGLYCNFLKVFVFCEFAKVLSDVKLSCPIVIFLSTKFLKPSLVYIM